jgi:receptor kinase-like protein
VIDKHSALMIKIMELSYHLLTIHLLILSLSSFPLAAMDTNSKPDLAALLSFKSQIYVDPLGVFSSWNESLHYCQWQGVLCGARHPDRVTALVLDSKQLLGYISPSLANLTFIQRIKLSNNKLMGNIPSELGYLGRLRYVQLSTNFLDGSIPSTLGNCSKLNIISLANNSLTGSIPLTLGNLINLTILDLDQNNLSGPIPSILGNLTNLIELSIIQNRLSGAIPSTLGNMNNMRHLYLFRNRLSGSIPVALGKLQNLLYINIFDNIITGEIPHTLYNISTMVALELGANQLKGTLPSDMCDGLPNLQYLFLFGNQLNGQIPPSISNCSALCDIELDSNYFNGVIPSTIGNLKNLDFFGASSNQLVAKTYHDWSFMNALANCTSFKWLYLENNELQGVMPSSIAKLSTGLLVLSISYNPISGSIPIELRKYTNLTALYLDHMLLSGSISEEIGNFFRLEYLDMSHNMISGPIPPSFGNLTKMTRLLLNNNAFEASIPPELVNMRVLEIINLSNNKLTGKIPKEIMNLPSLSISLDLSHNYLTDNLPPEIGNLKNLQLIRLSSNKLSGELPRTIGGCQELQVLYLNNNLFQGTIPYTLRNLRYLQVLDVSNNSFSGQVPEFIGTMNLQYLNISFNNFEGELPREGIFKNISGLDVRGNPKLCGGIPELHLPRCISEPPKQRHKSSKYIILISSILVSSICLTIAIYLLVIYHSRKRPQNFSQSDRHLKYELKHVSYNDLLKATENFSSKNLIGSGAFGTVYKAIMSFENVTTVAVKVLNLERHGASKSFFSECEALRNVRHRNLIKVLNLCSSIDHQGSDFKALIFEFMPNGSLAEWLHPESHTSTLVRSLNLFQRLNISIDVAMALDYLHYNGPTPIVHCDLKPSNILLDDHVNAKVGDFGLARFLVQPDTMPSQSMTSTGGIKGSIGYIPPGNIKLVINTFCSFYIHCKLLFIYLVN